MLFLGCLVLVLKTHALTQYATRFGLREGGYSEVILAGACILPVFFQEDSLLQDVFTSRFVDSVLLLRFVIVTLQRVVLTNIFKNDRLDNTPIVRWSTAQSPLL